MTSQVYNASNSQDLAPWEFGQMLIYHYYQ